MARKRNRKMTQKAYEASTQGGRRLSKWDAPALSPTNAIVTELDILRRRSRSAIRNNPFLSRALSVAVTNEVGTGIIPRPATVDKDFNRNILELWKDYIPFADVSNGMNIYGFQQQAVRARMESGECFIRIIRKRSDSSLPVPIQFQIIEADYIPLWLDKDNLNNGNKIVSGIEVNKFNKPVAYWTYKNHPDDRGSLTGTTDLLRIPANDMIHHFIPERPGALRGVPKGVQSSVTAKIYDEYSDAELGRKSSRSNFTGVIRRPDYGEEDYAFDPISGQPISKDTNDVPIIDMETGTFPNLLPGEDITLFQGDDSGRGYVDFQRQQLLSISAGWNIPYQFLSNDYTLVNDRIMRVILNEYHREVEQIQELYIIKQIVSRMWSEFVTRAILAGSINAPVGVKNNFGNIRAKFITQGWKHIHPVQDVQGKILEINSGLTSRQRVIDENKPESIEEIDAQRSDDIKREKELGLFSENKDKEKK